IKGVLRALFETPTVAGLARRIEGAAGANWGVPHPPLARADRHGDLPLSFAQQRLWFMDHLAPGNPFYNMPATMRLQGALNWDALERSLNETVRRHEVLRTTFPTRAGKPVQVIGPKTTRSLAVIDLRELPESQRTSRALEFVQQEAECPFDLACGPLFRP